MIKEFQREVERRIAAKVKLRLLETLPVLGASELADNPSSPQLRERALKQILSARA